MRRRVTAVPALYESLLLLDRSEATVRAGTLLLRRAVRHSASSATFGTLGVNFRARKKVSLRAGSVVALAGV